MFKELENNDNIEEIIKEDPENSITSDDTVSEGSSLDKAEENKTNKPRRNGPRPEHNRRPSGANGKRRRPQGEGRPRPDGQRRPRPDGSRKPVTPGEKRRPAVVKKKKWSKKKKGIVIASIIIGFLVLVIATVLFLIFRLINKMDIVTDDEDDFEILESIDPDPYDLKNSRPDSPEADKKALEEALRRNLLENEDELVSDDNVINILLIGCDARSKSGRGRSDSMILLSLNKNTKKVVMTSFLRDTWVEIPGVGPQRLNAAYFFGGPKLLIKTMQANFHIRIDKYARVNFYSFIDAVDAIDGVVINVTEEELEYINDYIKGESKLVGKDPNDNLVKKAGKQTLNGIQALAYARIRYVGTDFARTQRQRNVMNELFRKAKNLGLLELNDFLEKVLPNVTTNLERGQIFSLILHASDYLSYERSEQSIPNLGSFKNMVIDGMMVLGIDFEKYNKELKESIYGE